MFLHPSRGLMSGGPTAQIVNGEITVRASGLSSSAVPVLGLGPSGSAKKLIAFICRLSRNLGASTLSKIKALTRPVQELLQFYCCIVYIALCVKCPKLQDIMIQFDRKMLYQHMPDYQPLHR